MRPNSIKLFILVLPFLLSAFTARAQSQEVEVPGPPPPSAAPSPSGSLRNYPVHGMIGLDYIYRDVETGFHDNDLYTYLSLDLGNPGSNRVSGHLYARLSADLDGLPDEEDTNYFSNIVDYYDEPVNFRLYAAYVDFNRLGPVKLVRLGRQEMWGSPLFLFFDGARAESVEAKQFLNFKLGAYGGLAVRQLYETSTAGDELVWGAYAQTRPWEGARAQVHFTHLQDNNYYGNLDEEYLAVTLRQSLMDRFLVEGSYSWVDNHPRDLRGRLLFFIPESDTQVQVSYYELIEPQRQLTLELDYFYWVMQSLMPYRNVSVTAYQGLGKYFAVQGGYDQRTLTEDPQSVFETAFNHEYTHYFATLIVRPVEGLELSGTGENWRTTNDNSMNLTNAAGDITLKLDTRFRLSAGSFYSLYKYDFLLSDEQEQVTTYYAKLRWAPVKYFRLDLGYEYEETGYEDFNTARVGINYIF